VVQDGREDHQPKVANAGRTKVGIVCIVSFYIRGRTD